METLFQIIILIFSAILHEYSHGAMAYSLGDPTAKNAGRLTLNPMAHLDWFGSVLLPAVMVLSRLPFVFGWAKPVPYNPYLLKDRRWGDAKVAIAGPAANLAIAIALGLVIRLMPFSEAFTNFVAIAVLINIVLAVFNLVPLPPLDGSKILASFLPEKLKVKYLSLERFGFILVIVFVMFGVGIIEPLVFGIFRLITGMGI
ncbi:MAG: site-2 protease family protein [Candidatus Falkowbacteria bacterium]|nr:site-2 protease family protein [Candidatus Falkowbacteria bacterium]